MPLALLLFLVCAMLASIVLAAATASAGQATTLTKSEQSYYAVTSAAKLFRDELDGQTVIITQTKTTPENAGAGASATYTLQIDGKSTLTSPTLLELSALGTLTGAQPAVPVGGLALNNYASSAWKLFGQETGSTALTSTLNLDASVADAGGVSAASIKSALDATVEQEIRPDGSIVLTFRQKKASGAADDGYALKLVLTADVEIDDEAGAGAAENTETRETRVTWWADEISAAGGDAA